MLLLAHWVPRTGNFPSASLPAEWGCTKERRCPCSARTSSSGSEVPDGCHKHHRSYGEGASFEGQGLLWVGGQAPSPGWGLLQPSEVWWREPLSWYLSSGRGHVSRATTTSVMKELAKREMGSRATSRARGSWMWFSCA